MTTKNVSYPRMKVKIRFVGHLGKPCTSVNMLKGLLPALWNQGDRREVIATIDNFVNLFNNNLVFFYPFPLDYYRTGLLDKHVGGYQHFSWEIPEEDVPPLCENCRDWDFSTASAPARPFFMCGQAHAFVCPNCHGIVVDEYAEGKAGRISWLTRKQFCARFGIDAAHLIQD